MDFETNFIRFPAVQKVRKSVKISRRYTECKGGNFFKTHCIHIYKMIARAEARSASRAEAFQPGHLTWRALASRRHW